MSHHICFSCFGCLTFDPSAPPTPPPLRGSYKIFKPGQITLLKLYFHSAAVTYHSQTHQMSWEITLASMIFPQTECSAALCLSRLHQKPRLHSAPLPLSSSCWSGAGLNKEKLKGKGKYVSLCQPSSVFLPQLPEQNVRQEEAEHFGQTSPALSVFFSVTVSDIPRTSANALASAGKLINSTDYLTTSL